MNYASSRVASSRLGSKKESQPPLPLFFRPIKVHANHACTYTRAYTRAAHPPHVMNIFTLIAGLGDFSSAPVSADPSIEDTLFISTGRVRLVPNPLDILFVESMSLGDGLMISLN